VRASTVERTFERVKESACERACASGSQRGSESSRVGSRKRSTRAFDSACNLEARRRGPSLRRSTSINVGRHSRTHGRVERGRKAKRKRTGRGLARCAKVLRERTCTPRKGKSPDPACCRSMTLGSAKCRQKKNRDSWPTTVISRLTY